MLPILACDTGVMDESLEIISFLDSLERAHLDILGNKVIGYSDKQSLHKILVNFKPEEHSMENNGYLE